jgi:hypothetical protein
VLLVENEMEVKSEKDGGGGQYSIHSEKHKMYIRSITLEPALFYLLSYKVSSLAKN